MYASQDVISFRKNTLRPFKIDDVNTMFILRNREKY